MNLPSDIGYDSSSGAGVRWPWLLGVDVIDDSVGPKDMHEVTSDGVIHRLGAELRVDCVGYHVSKMTLLTLSSAKTATFKPPVKCEKCGFADLSARESDSALRYPVMFLTGTEVSISRIGSRVPVNRQWDHVGPFGVAVVWR